MKAKHSEIHIGCMKGEKAVWNGQNCRRRILEGWKEREVISLLEAFFYREFKCAKEGAPDGKRMRNTSGEHKEKGDVEHKEKGEKSGHIQ